MIWTSNTDMKIETRTIGSVPSSPVSSRGTGTRSIIVTSPSAGAITRSSPRGVVRTGSRKNAATHTVSPSIGQKKMLEAIVSSRVRPNAMATNFCPSG